MPPNFIFILADDLGYADLGCYGGRAPVSPNIDRMAAQGLRFTRGYANSAVCSPTRFALATGRYQYRIRGAAEEPIGSAMRGDKVIGLPPDHPTLPSRLHEAGYRTALVGKWHLGFPPHFGPLTSGYDEHFGPVSGGVDYFTHQDSFGMHDLFENGAEVHRDGYLTDLLSDRAVEFVSRCADERKPFLLSLHYTAPHWPWETREDEAAGQVARPRHRPSRRRHDPCLPAHDPSHGRGHRPRPGRARRQGHRPGHDRRLHQRQWRRALLRQLAAGRRQDGPDGRRHPRALRGALARPRRRPARRPTSSPSPWTGCRPSSRPPARAPIPTIRATAPRCSPHSASPTPSPTARCSGA